MNCAGCGIATVNHAWLCPPCNFWGRVSLPHLVIGIGGRARHGKNTVADVLLSGFRERNVATREVTISSVVWDEAVRLRLVRSSTRASATHWELKKLVELGHAERAKNEDRWLELVTRNLVAESTRVAIVPGIRFANEVAWLRQAPRSVLVKVVRHDADGNIYRSPDRDATDPMETTIDGITADLELHHVTGQLPWLVAQARTLLITCVTGVGFHSDLDRPHEDPGNR
jgi:hypothetical protein